MKHEPQAGDYLEPDGWRRGGECIIADTDTYTDAGWAGCEWRIKLFPAILLGINIKVTGNPRRTYTGFRSRVKIEYVGDYEPSTFAGGWLYHKAD